MSPRTVVGIDLAGVAGRTTGFCRLEESLAVALAPLHQDREILRATLEAAPVGIGIDAPLSIPRGRRTIGDRRGPHFRACDLELRRRGIRFFPVTLGPMRTLTRRGMRLARSLSAVGAPVVETYPGAVQDLLGLPRKSAGVLPLRRGIERLGLDLGPHPETRTHDELDAVCAAIAVLLDLWGWGELIGEATEGRMLLPRPEARGRSLEELRGGPGPGGAPARGAGSSGAETLDLHRKPGGRQPVVRP